MKTKLMKTASLLALAMSLSACGTTMTDSQRNTAVGAFIGGVAGNMLGDNTESTLGGAALGGLIGSQINGGNNQNRNTAPYRDGYYNGNYNHNHW